MDRYDPEPQPRLAHGVPGRRAALLPACVAACCALLLYAPLLSRSYDGNGIIEALAVDAGGPRLWNPNHLFYRPLGVGLDTVARALGYQGRSIGPLQMVSAVSGAVAVGIVLLIGWRLSRDWWAASLAAAFYAIAWAQWTFSTDAGYMTLAAASAAAAVAWVVATDGSTRSALLGGALCALAILSWQANVFLVPVVMAGLWLGPVRRLRRVAALLAGTTAALVLVLYVAAAALAGRAGGVIGALAWASSYSGGGSGALPVWGTWSLSQVAKAAHAWASSLLPIWQGLGLRALARGVVQPDKVLPQLAALAALAVCAASLVRAWQARRRGTLSGGALIWLAAGVLAYLPFIVWWDPGAPKWFLVPNLFLAAAAAIVWAGTRPLGRAALGLAIATIAAANFTAAIWPAHVGTSPFDALARCVAGRLERRDLILITDWGWHDHAVYWYAVPGESLQLVGAQPASEKLASIAERLAGVQQRGGHVYAMQIDRSLPERVAWLRALTQLRPEDFDRFAPRPAFTCDGMAFVELTGRAGGAPSGRASF